MNLQGKINLIKAAKNAIKSAIIAMGVIPSGNISTYADAITQIDTVKNTSLTVNPSTTAQTLRPSSEYTGYSVVNVNPVTASIDSDITANNIKTGVEILGVTGEVDELIGQTKTITENGVYTPDDGYTGFTSVTVDTPIGIRREVKNGVYQMPTSSFTFSLPDDATELGYNAMNYAFYGCTGLTSINLSNLTTISGQNAMSSAFKACSELTNVDLSSLTTISGQTAMSSAFYRCINLTNVDLSSLTTVSGQSAMNSAFYSCTNLTSVDLSSLTYINESRAMQLMFENCVNLETLSFPQLKTTSFGNYSDQFNNMLYRVAGCTVHFPSNLQSVIGSWSDVVSGFGGTNTTVLFDLPATT